MQGVVAKTPANHICGHVTEHSGPLQLARLVIKGKAMRIEHDIQRRAAALVARPDIQPPLNQPSHHLMVRAQCGKMQCGSPARDEHIGSGFRAQQVCHARNIIEPRGAPKRRDAIIVQRIDIKALAHQPFDARVECGLS